MVPGQKATGHGGTGAGGGSCRAGVSTPERKVWKAPSGGVMCSGSRVNRTAQVAGCEQTGQGQRGRRASVRRRQGSKKGVRGRPWEVWVPGTYKDNMDRTSWV